MGLSPFRGCASTGGPNPPNPDPARWELLDKYVLPKAYVLVVRYLDARNFEGVKVLVYRGEYPGDEVIQASPLDPRFSGSGGPVARFRPTGAGALCAARLARRLDAARVVDGPTDDGGLYSGV